MAGEDHQNIDLVGAEQRFYGIYNGGGDVLLFIRTFNGFYYSVKLKSGTYGEGSTVKLLQDTTLTPHVMQNIVMYFGQYAYLIVKGYPSGSPHFADFYGGISPYSFLTNSIVKKLLLTKSDGHHSFANTINEIFSQSRYPVVSDASEYPFYYFGFCGDYSGINTQLAFVNVLYDGVGSSTHVAESATGNCNIGIYKEGGNFPLVHEDGNYDHVLCRHKIIHNIPLVYPSSGWFIGHGDTYIFNYYTILPDCHLFSFIKRTEIPLDENENPMKPYSPLDPTLDTSSLSNWDLDGSDKIMLYNFIGIRRGTTELYDVIEVGDTYYIADDSTILWGYDEETKTFEHTMDVPEKSVIIFRETDDWFVLDNDTYNFSIDDSTPSIPTSGIVMIGPVSIVSESEYETKMFHSIKLSGNIFGNSSVSITIDELLEDHFIYGPSFDNEMIDLTYYKDPEQIRINPGLESKVKIEIFNSVFFLSDVTILKANYIVRLGHENYAFPKNFYKIPSRTHIKFDTYNWRISNWSADGVTIPVFSDCKCRYLYHGFTLHLENFRYGLVTVTLYIGHFLLPDKKIMLVFIKYDADAGMCYYGYRIIPVNSIIPFYYKPQYEYFNNFPLEGNILMDIADSTLHNPGQTEISKNDMRGYDFDNIGGAEEHILHSVSFGLTFGFDTKSAGKTDIWDDFYENFLFHLRTFAISGLYYYLAVNSYSYLYVKEDQTTISLTGKGFYQIINKVEYYGNYWNFKLYVDYKDGTYTFEHGTEDSMPKKYTYIGDDLVEDGKIYQLTTSTSTETVALSNVPKTTVYAYGCYNGIHYIGKIIEDGILEGGIYAVRCDPKLYVWYNPDENKGDVSEDLVYKKLGISNIRYFINLIPIINKKNKDKFYGY